MVKKAETLPTKVAELEVSSIHKAIADSGNNLRSAAKALGIARSTLYRKMDEYKIKRKR